MNAAANGQPHHAPFPLTTAQPGAPADTRRPPPPAEAGPWGGRLRELEEARLTPQEDRLVDVLIEHALGVALDVLMQRIDARFDALECRIFGEVPDAPGQRDERRPPRPDSPAAEPPCLPEDDPVPAPPEPAAEPPGDPGPAQVPAPAENRRGVLPGFCFCERGCPACRPEDYEVISGHPLTPAEARAVIDAERDAEGRR